MLKLSMLLFLDLPEELFLYPDNFIFLLKTVEFVGEVKNIYLTGSTFPDILTFNFRHFFDFSFYSKTLFDSFYKLF